MIICPHCRVLVDDSAQLPEQRVACPHCHGEFLIPTPQPVAPFQVEPRGSVKAAVASFFLIGLGQCINGRVRRGVAFFLMAVLLFCLAPCTAFTSWIPLFYVWYVAVSDGYYDWDDSAFREW